MAELTLRLPDFSGPALLLQAAVKQTRYWLLLLGWELVERAHSRWCSCGRLG